ncbi:hypothetical protein Tco_0559796 [Tanacetum coccineum]
MPLHHHIDMTGLVPFPAGGFDNDIKRSKIYLSASSVGYKSVGEEDEEYEESDDEEMEVLDEDEETNDGDDSVE